MDNRPDLAAPDSVTPFSLRLAALTLELIERRGLSLEKAYLEAAARAERHDASAMRLARLALLSFAKADLLLRAHRLEGVPLRRRCAFRVAFALLLAGGDVGHLDVGLLSGRLRSLLTRKGVEEVERLLSGLPPLERAAVENSFPPWLLEEAARFLGFDEAVRLAKACSRRVIWLRINELKVSVGEAVRRLRQVADVREDKDFHEVVELVGTEELPPPVLKLVERGYVVVQDKGSVAVAHALGDSRNLLVLDAAAAPGLKTSLIQQLSGNAAEVVAIDISRRRLEEMRGILSRLGVRNVHLVHSDSVSIKLARKFDKVLLDAPCTNTGAIASDPALRLSLWRRPNVEGYASLQRRLLSNTLVYLKVGGSLVYSTCSLLSGEGEGVIDSMGRLRLSADGLLGLPGYPGFACSAEVRRLFPHVHRTTGFFVARIVKE